jgi:hypothetical protein
MLSRQDKVHVRAGMPLPVPALPVLGALMDFLRRFKFTLFFTVLFAVVCGLMFAGNWGGVWWYILACFILVMFIFIGELGR